MDKKYRLLLVVTCCCLVSNSHAQYKISRSVFGNGAVVTKNDSLKMVGTVGQVAIGVISDDNFQNQTGFWYQQLDLKTSVEQTSIELPDKFELHQNYPNPFNPTTTIGFALPEDAHVALIIYDLLGRQVAALLDENRQAGTHQVVFEAEQLPSGVYFYRIESKSFTKVRKLTLLK